MFDIVKGSLVKVIDYNKFVNKPYYKIEENENLNMKYLISHPYKIVDDDGTNRWLQRTDIVPISIVRNLIIDDILR